MTASTSPFNMPFSPFNTDTFKSMFPMPDSMGSLARDAMEASTESTRASVKGMQDAGSAMMSQLKKQMTLSVETGKQLSEATTLEDAMEIQTAYVKKAVEANIKGFTELSELYADTLRETFAPLAKQAKKATKKT
ncbi:MAG: phasin family protein [Henriciella sp.]|nr:phasin family protein [Henriciella sp.]